MTKADKIIRKGCIDSDADRIISVKMQVSVEYGLVFYRAQREM